MKYSYRIEKISNEHVCLSIDDENSSNVVVMDWRFESNFDLNYNGDQVVGRAYWEARIRETQAEHLMRFFHSPFGEIACSKIDAVFKGYYGEELSVDDFIAELTRLCESIRWSKIVRFDGCAYTVVDGVLLYAALNEDGTIETDPEFGFNWSEVTDFHPKAVELVNREFGTNFKANVGV